jgi:hypothetical protein
LTRHELKEQLQHDQFTDTVSQVLLYAQTNRQQFIRYGILAAIAAVVIGGVFWYRHYTNGQREQDLERVFLVLDAPVGPANPGSSVNSFQTQDAKNKASLKALNEMIAKDGGSRQGLMAQYYRGTLRVQMGDTAHAESDLKAVANTGNPTAPLAKIALAQLYAGQNKMSEAQQLLNGIVNKPTDLVSKGQAEILLARLDQTINPKETKKILQGLSTPKEDLAVRRAADQLSSELK